MPKAIDAEGAVGRGVGVAADDRHAGLGETELRADDVDDALVDVAQRVQAYAELRGVLAQRLDLGPRDRVGDGLVDVQRRDVVVLGGERQVGSAYGPAGEAQPVEGLRRGDLVDEVEVDVEQVGLTLGLSDDVLVPHLLRQRASHDASSMNPCVICLPPLTPRLHISMRDGIIRVWTTLAESASSTKPPSCSRPWSPDRPRWPVSSPPPAWPARPPTASRWRWSTTAWWRATCRAASCSDPAWPSSAPPPARTGCSPPPARCWRGCATSPASPPSCGAARATTASASPPPSVPRACATRSRSARS